MGFSELVQGGGGAACEKTTPVTTGEEEEDYCGNGGVSSFRICWSSLVPVGVLNKRRVCGDWRRSDRTGATWIKPGLGADGTDRARALPVRPPQRTERFSPSTGSVYNLFFLFSDSIYLYFLLDLDFSRSFCSDFFFHMIGFWIGNLG
uniref:Uncharacterized protein n=1 Tax=Oryza rufipogon TaxID=4529 RepID=A0A0E0N1L0_ORYRU